MKIAVMIVGLLLILLPIGFWVCLKQQYGTIPDEAVAIIGGQRIDLRITLTCLALSGVAIILPNIFWYKKSV
jgi:hypothetical protein|tara:strand:- start:320 stop:535 length:216 start_codon:yes stop_codon:yes gene_type:complete